MILALALVLAAGVADTSTRVPGTVLRFGMPPDRVSALVTLASSGGAGDGMRAFTGDIRFFGLPSHATLSFGEGRLARASFEAKNVSPHSQSYVEDELRRLGYRRRCTALDPKRHVCDWLGATNVHLEIAEQTITAQMEPTARAMP